MSYRDDLDAAQARVDALEQELAQTRKELAIARGEGPELALVPVESTALVRGNAGGPVAPRWLGAPLQLGFERILDGELPEASHTELIECVRRAIGTVGTTTVLPGSLAWTTTAPSNGLAPQVNVYITSRDGKTTIRLEQKLGNLVGGIFGGVGGGVGGGGVMLPVAVAVISPVLVPFAIAAWFGGTYALCRRLFRGRAAKHAERLDRMLDELAKIATRYIERARTP